ncbi:MAG: inorganic phosphate transporter [Deltaproteobacteria bacterium]|nr:inorganic phosphate transporter [Deltaproteobacteria bacterium]
MEIGVALALVFGLFLSYANGANDNFKGCATLYGSGTLSYRRSLFFSALAQALGSLTALLLAQGLIGAFSGKGLVPDAVVAMKSFALAVALGTAATVMLATRFGFPISTTHALTGALVGSGLLASSSGVNYSKLGAGFFTPLLVSPVLALAGSSLFYLGLRFARAASGISKETCVCVGEEVVGVLPAGMTASQAIAAGTFPSVTVATEAVCVERYRGSFLGVGVERALDGVHVLSGAAVCFARALNDTPKIAATLLVGGAFSPTAAILGVAVVMAVGGLVNSRRVAETMSHKVTELSPGQGLSANLVTAVLVVFASKVGLPVSTTHVSCGSLFGIGAVTGRAHGKTIAGILLAWVTTLPLAAASSAASFLALRHVVG